MRKVEERERCLAILDLPPFPHTHGRVNTSTVMYSQPKRQYNTGQLPFNKDTQNLTNLFNTMLGLIATKKYFTVLRDKDTNTGQITCTNRMVSKRLVQATLST